MPSLRAEDGCRIGLWRWWRHRSQLSREVFRHFGFGSDRLTRTVDNGDGCTVLVGLGLRLTAGQVHDSVEAEALLEGALGDGATLLADKGYDSNAIRALAEKNKTWANIPVRSNRKGSFAFYAWVYRQRNLVERFFNRIK